MSATSKKIFGLLALIFLLLPIIGTRFHLLAISRSPIDLNDLHQFSRNSTVNYVPGEVIVKFKKDKLNIKSNSLLTVVKKFAFPLTKGLSAKNEERLSNTVIYKINSQNPVSQVVSALKQNADVEYAEPNYINYPSSLGTNDTYASKLWGLNNTGQTLTLDDGTSYPGTTGDDVKMPEAWALSTGVTDVIVAVIDSGVAYNHPDLINNMWDGTNCVDENGSALGSCLHGYDFGNGDKDPTPDVSSHGTHVAGTIAATQNNSKGIAGVGPRIKIMALKCDILSISCVTSSINFAIQNGAKIINASFGGVNYSSAEYDAIQTFQNAGGIFVAAAGNCGDVDTYTYNGCSSQNQTFYPADFNLSNIISVAATDQNDALASFSNHDPTAVDVGAPGVNIYSTWDESYPLNQSFNGVTAPAIPSGWTSDGNSAWGTYNIGGTGPIRNFLYGDVSHTPYLSSINSTLTHSTIDLSAYSNAKFDVKTHCDTEYTNPYGVGSSSSDYMALEVSSDGTNFNELTRWNSYSLFHDYGATAAEIGETLPSQYLTSNFKFRLRWVTDSDTNYGGGDGCNIQNNFQIITYTDGSDEKYQYDDGTSMAAPHVAGLAGYLWSISPGLSYDQIISNILTNGDSISSLSGKTVTGKRINAYNSVLALGITSPPLVGPSVTGLTDDAVPARSKTWTWSSANPSTDTYRFLVDQSLSSAPTGSYGTGTSATISEGSGTFYIHVQAQDSGNNAGPVTTVSCILDNTGPQPTISGSANGFTLNFGEILHSFSGGTFTDGQNMSTFFTVNPSSVGSSITYSSNSISFILPNAIVGTKITLNTGSSATNLFDSLGNASSGFLVMLGGNGNYWFNPTSLSVGTTNFPDLFVSGVFVTTPGTGSDQSSQINTTISLLVGASDASGNNTVDIPNNTNISELSNADFNPSQIQLNLVDPGTVSGLDSGNVPEAALQWGIVGTTLKFNNPLTVNLYVGSTFDGHSLNVFRSPSLGTGWTTTGITSSPATCVVSSGTCQFTATEASYYVAAFSAADDITPTPTTTPIPTDIPTSPPSSDNGPPPIFIQEHSAPQCSASTPSQAPDLFKIITGKGTAKIIFIPVNNTPITGYEVIYGLKKDDQRFAAIFNTINNNQGEQSFTVGQLNPKSTYYFRVAAVNSCTSGPLSGWISAKANGKKTINKYKTKLVNKKVVLIDLFK